MTALALRTPRFVPRSAIPGFGLTFGITLAWLGLIVLIPLAAMVLRPWELGVAGVLASLGQPRVLAALQVSFGLSLLAAAANVPIGLLLAWVLTRYRFPLRRLTDALIDLPFALPTAVAGIALTALYAPNGWLGAKLAALGIQVAYTQAGIFLALLFIGLPYVVRMLQPVLMDLDAAQEEVAATLGAGRWQVFRRVVLPAVAPTLLSGFGLAFGRAVGEYGSVIFIAGNIPLVTEIAPLLIVIRLEQFDYAGAAAVGLAMLVASFAILMALALVRAWLRRGR